ncbi:MAG TPA: hypothetical protein VE008_07380 [Burkholderiales bacterium]|nr:hypothetical protein [Burkholderiales bacterium]
MSEIIDRIVPRSAIVEEARSWLRTPWHHMARVKGQGVDCAQFLCAVYEAAGSTPHIELGAYPRDWHLHQARPRFLEVLSRYAEPIHEALPGDIAMFRFGRHPAHGSIVIAWPRILHAYREERMVVESDVAASPRLAERLSGFWRLKSMAG